MCTVQAPHCATPQPYLVPVRPTCSRITHSRGVVGSTSTSWDLPLIVRRIATPPLSCGLWPGDADFRARISYPYNRFPVKVPASHGGHMVFVKRFAAVLSVAVLAAWPGALVQAQAPDLILHNGKVVTVDPAFSIAEGVAIRRDRFVAVGTNDAVRRTAGPATRMIDLRGRTVIPGLMDGHLHNAGGGPGVDLAGVRSMAELLAAVEARGKGSKPGDLGGSNSDWQEAQLREKRLPHRRDLDRVAPDNPVVLVRGGHEFIVNSAAMKRWNITRSTPVPPGGEIGHDADGELNGELVDTARGLVKLPPPPKLAAGGCPARLNGSQPRSVTRRPHP